VLAPRAVCHPSRAAETTTVCPPGNSPPLSCQPQEVRIGTSVTWQRWGGRAQEPDEFRITNMTIADHRPGGDAVSGGAGGPPLTSSQRRMVPR
jgi:hypothetical protein